jgi:hypothetical protein
MMPMPEKANTGAIPAMPKPEDAGANRGADSGGIKQSVANMQADARKCGYDVHEHKVGMPSKHY